MVLCSRIGTKCAVSFTAVKSDSACIWANVNGIYHRITCCCLNAELKPRHPFSTLGSLKPVIMFYYASFISIMPNV